MYKTLKFILYTLMEFTSLLKTNKNRYINSSQYSLSNNALGCANLRKHQTPDINILNTFLQKSIWLWHTLIMLYTLICLYLIFLTIGSVLGQQNDVSLILDEICIPAAQQRDSTHLKNKDTSFC